MMVFLSKGYFLLMAFILSGRKRGVCTRVFMRADVFMCVHADACVLVVCIIVCVGLHNKCRFKALSAHLVDYNKIPSNPMKQKTKTQKDNIATLIVLQSVDEPSFKLIIGNTHLFWVPSAASLRILQAHMLAQAVMELKTKYGMYFRWAQVNVWKKSRPRSANLVGNWSGLVNIFIFKILD